MPKTTADAKNVQLRKLMLIFSRYPGGSFSSRELANQLGCSERTIPRYMDELGTTGQLMTYQDGLYRWHIVEGSRVPLAPLELDLREGTALYLAARLLAQGTDERNDHVMSALHQLIRVMPQGLDKQLEYLVNTAATAQPREPDVTERFSALVQGWAKRRIVMVTYRPARPPFSARTFEYQFCPYLFEPSAIGRTVYVIGATLPKGTLRTFKLERIEHAKLIEERFTVPDDFDGAALLRRAWGVMYGDEEPVTVRLRFSKFVARRVKETIWHISQQITDLTDGGCEWQAEIGDITEIGPWVRGWGRDCEVLAPEDLRLDVIKHVRHMARAYQLELATAEKVHASERPLVTQEDRMALDDIFG